MSRYLFASIVIFLTFFHVTAENQFPIHMVNFTQEADGRLLLSPTNPRWKFWNATASTEDTAIPHVYRDIPNVQNPVLALQPRNNTLANAVYGTSSDYQNLVLLTDFKVQLTGSASLKVCVAAEGFDPQMPDWGEMYFFFPKHNEGGGNSNQNQPKESIRNMLNSAGEIQSAQITVNAYSTCAGSCDFRFFIYLATIAVNQTSNNLANPQARFYITSPKVDINPTLNETECPTNLLSLIRTHQASLVPSSSTNSSTSTGSATNSTSSTSTGDSSAPTNSSSSNNSNSTSTGGGSSIFTNSSESSSATSTPTPTPTAAPTTPPPALPITTLNFNGNTILTIDNASKFKGPSNGYLVSAWFKLLSSSLPPLDTPQTVFRAMATTPASTTITQLGLVLIRTRPSAYTIRLIVGNGAYEWTFTELRHDEWEHILAVRNDDYVYLVINNRRLESQKGVGAETFGATPTTAVIGGSGINGQTVNEAFTGLLHRIVVTTGSYELKIKMPSSTEVSAYATTIYNNGIPANITVYPGLDPKIMYVLTNDTKFMKTSNGQVRFIDQLNSHDTTTEALANSATINFVQQSPGVAVPTTSSPTTASPTTSSPTISSSSSSSNSSTGDVGGSSSPNNTTQSSSGAGSSSSSTAGATPPNAAYQNTISIAAIVITGITWIGRLF